MINAIAHYMPTFSWHNYCTPLIRGILLAERGSVAQVLLYIFRPPLPPPQLNKLCNKRPIVPGIIFLNST